MKTTMSAKELAAAVCAAVLACCLAGCVSEPAEESAAPTEQPAPEQSAPSIEPTPKEDDLMQERIIEVADGDIVVTFELNDSAAATALCDQLPLAVEVSDFSTNEKIFYPPEPLDVADAPHAEGGAGTLAYYEPWGDVVLFYGDYAPNDGLYELGRAVAGAEAIGDLSGELTIAAVA